MRAITLGRTIDYRRYATIAIASVVGLLLPLFLFAEGVSLIGTDAIPAPNWRRLDSQMMLVRHQLNKLREGPHILVFGTSRNNMLSSENLKRPVINLNQIYGAPRGILRCLRTLDAEQMRNIEKVYILADYHTLDKRRYGRDLDFTFLGYVRDTFSNFTLYRVWVAIKTIGINLGMPHPYYLTGNGNVVPAVADAYTGFGVPQQVDRNFRFDAADELKDLQSFLKEKGIEAVFYTATLPTKVSKEFGEDLMLRYMRVLSSTLDRHYHLIYVPEISRDDRNFSDESHLNANAYRKLYLETDWNRFLVTPANAEERIKQLRAALWNK